VVLDPKSGLPLVSIITPCLNMARFIGHTVRSVLEQDYPHIEHVVMDGGSTDGTLEALDAFRDRVRVFSEPDRGAADAINKGFARTSGEIVTFLNADDFYYPGAVAAAVRGFAETPGSAAIYGDGVWVDAAGEIIEPYPVEPFDRQRLAYECFICQPASFLRRGAIESIGLLDASLRYTFDYDLWIRLSRQGRVVKIDERLAASRMHSDNISLGSRKAVFQETIALLRRHFGYVPFRWVRSYCSFRIDRRDQFFEPLRPGFAKYAASLPVGLFYNWRHPLRYVGEWGSVMSREGLERRINAVWRRERK